MSKLTAGSGAGKPSVFGAFGLEHETRTKVEKRIANAKKIFVLITVVFKIRYKITTKNLNMQEMKRFFLYISKKRSIFAQNFVRRNEKKIIYIACEFLKPLASNIKSWIVSKKFSLGNGHGQ